MHSICTFKTAECARKIPVPRRIKTTTSVFHRYAHFSSISTLVHYMMCTLNSLKMHFFAHFLHIFYHLKGNSEETQRTPAQVILIKLGQMAEGKIDSDWFRNSIIGSWIWLVNFRVLGWTDFFIGNVIERPGRAENFKERSFLISDWSFRFPKFSGRNWPIGIYENKTLKARMAARIERIEKHYIDCKRND